MNLSLLATQALYFLLGFAPAAVPGMGCYWMFRSRFLIVRVLAALAFVGFFAAYIANVAQIWPYLVNWFALLIQPGLVVFVSVGQAFLERVLSRPRISWGRAFGVCLATNICLFCVIRYFFLADMTLSYALLGVFSSTGTGATQSWGYFLGTLLTPLSISFFRWMLPHLKLRPGLDREFEDGEFAR